jgi:hypothetical protein
MPSALARPPSLQLHRESSVRGLSLFGLVELRLALLRVYSAVPGGNVKEAWTRAGD